MECLGCIRAFFIGGDPQIPQYTRLPPVHLDMQFMGKQWQTFSVNIYIIIVVTFVDEENAFLSSWTLLLSHHKGASAWTDH